MGTNYTWRTNACACCGRYDELHVGKSGRMFEGHFRWDPDTGEATPTITTWQEWKTLLLDSDGELRDECGVPVRVDWFIGYVERTPPELRRSHYDWVRDHTEWRYASGRPAIGEVAPAGDWLCPDGFSFHGGEFT